MKLVVFVRYEHRARAKISWGIYKKGLPIHAWAVASCIAILLFGMAVFFFRSFLVTTIIISLAHALAASFWADGGVIAIAISLHWRC
jgi:hypothetical protein